MPLTPGSSLGPYEILAPLGAGGMGEVYLARDARLERDVAVKVLPQHLADHPEVRARFEREAKAVSALNHPHICTVHDTGVHEGQPYLVMERLTGQTLSHAIGKQPLPIEKVISLGEQIADALDVAHRAGIVHRDLKPANLFITDRGDAKVLDFGLAQMETQEATGASNAVSEDTPTVAPTFRTQLGTALGTVAYMSPEQARNERLDARSDLFSLGVVLYEMATARLPFEGNSPAEFYAAILKSEPRPPREWNAEVPAQLEDIILKALEKDPKLRYQTAAELRGDLLRLKRDSGAAVSAGRRASASRSQPPASKPQFASGSRRGLRLGVTAAAITLAIAIGYIATRGHETRTAPVDAATPDHSIAVLPFTDMSVAKDQEYFSDGISEELLNLLAKIPQLQVSARTSSFSFKGKEIAIPEIARRLHVKHVLEGSVRKVGDEVRITAQLIDATTDTHLWSQTYDRKLDDVFAIQDEIAADVAKQLKVQLLGAAPRALETDPRAYALYLQSVQFGRLRSAEGFAKSDSLLRRVLAIDPRYVPAWGVLSTNQLNEVLLGLLPAGPGLARARETAMKALEIDPDFPRGHANLGTIATLTGDIAGAAPHFERALALDPTDLIVLGNSATLLKSLGRLSDALALEAAVLRRDPVSTYWLFNRGNGLKWAGRYDESIEMLRTVLNLSPEFNGAHLVLGEALVGKGDAAGALAEIQKEPLEPFRLIGESIAYHALGRKADSDTALAALIAKYGKDAPYDIGYIYAYRGDADRAFEWLEKAAALKDPSFALVLVENFFTNIHSDPRWVPFLRKLGKAPEQVAKIPFKVTLPAGTPAS